MTLVKYVLAFIVIYSLIIFSYYITLRQVNHKARPRILIQLQCPGQDKDCPSKELLTNSLMSVTILETAITCNRKITQDFNIKCIVLHMMSETLVSYDEVTEKE